MHNIIQIGTRATNNINNNKRNGPPPSSFEQEGKKIQTKMHRFIFSLPEFCLIQHYKTFQVDYISLKFSKFCLKAMENI